MLVYAQVPASLQEYLPSARAASRVACELPQDATVADLMVQLGLPLDTHWIVVVDDKHVDVDAVLSEGQKVSIFPPLAGGAPCWKRGRHSGNAGERASERMRLSFGERR
jgi:molybdopterin converting factor small subunit